MPIPYNHSTPIRRSAKTIAFDQLQQWIIDRTLLPGEKLNDSELAEALGVSRTPVRESLQMLEIQGFVKMYPGKATQVTEADRELIYDLLPPIAALQALAAEIAVPHVTEEMIHQLKEINQRFAEAIRQENYFQSLEIDEEFHRVIVDTANNAYIRQMTEMLQAHVRRLFFQDSIILTEASIEEHKTIMQALYNKDQDRASNVTKENWLRTLEHFHKE